MTGVFGVTGRDDALRAFRDHISQRIFALGEHSQNVYKQIRRQRSTVRESRNLPAKKTKTSRATAGNGGNGSGGDGAPSASLSARGVILQRFVSTGDPMSCCQLAWSLRADSLRSRGAGEAERRGEGEGRGKENVDGEWKHEREAQGMADGGVVATKVEGQLFQDGRPLYAFRGDSAQALDSTINVTGNVLVTDSQSGAQFTSGHLSWNAPASRLLLTDSVSCSLPGTFHVTLPCVSITRASLIQSDSSQAEPSQAAGAAGEGAGAGAAPAAAAAEVQDLADENAGPNEATTTNVTGGVRDRSLQQQQPRLIFQQQQSKQQYQQQSQQQEQEQLEAYQEDQSIAEAPWWLTADAYVVAHGHVKGWVSLPSSLVTGSLRGISRLIKDAESSQRQQQGALGHGRHGLGGSGGGLKRRDGGKSGKRNESAWTGVECAGGFEWNVPRGEISLAGPISASCPSMDGQVRAGGGVIWLQRSEALLHSEVQANSSLGILDVMSSSAEDASEGDPRFERDRHVFYFVNCLNGLPAAYESQESNRLTLAYFCIVALDLLQALDKVDRQKILNWVHSLQVLDPEMLQTKRIGGNPVADSVTTPTPPPIAEAAASISTLSVQPDAGVSTLYVHADLATRNSSSSMAREQETTAGCGSSGNGPLCLGVDVLGFRGSPSIGVEYSTRGALKQSSYDCSHIAMTYTALAILATLKEDTVSSQGSATGGGADNAGRSLPDVRQHPVEGAGLLGEQVDERSSEGVGARGEDGNGVLGRREDGVCARGGDGVDTTAACSRAGEVRGMAKSLRELQLQDGSFMPVACGSESDMRFVFCAGEGW
ncbi:unnamed protein product [Closterium sp. NIES-54]